MALPAEEGPGLLYGIAVDLTPFDVLPASLSAAPVSAAPASGVQPESPMPSTTRTGSKDRVVILASHEPALLTFVGVGVAAVVLMMLVPSGPPTQPQVSEVGVARAPNKPASVPAVAISRTAPLEKTETKTKRRGIPPEVESAAIRAESKSPEPSKERSAEPLAATLQRLQEGFR